MERREQGERMRAAIVRAMIEHRERYGVWPSMDEIALAVGLAKSGVFRHLDTLAGDGYVARLPGLSRATWVTDAGRAWAELEHL